MAGGTGVTDSFLGGIFLGGGANWLMLGNMAAVVARYGSPLIIRLRNRRTTL